MGLGDFLSDLGSAVTRGLEAALPVASAAIPALLAGRQQNEQLRLLARAGFAPSQQAGLGDLFPTTELGEGILTMLGATPSRACPGRRMPARWSPLREVRCQHPDTGKIISWRYQGTPILYSGDRATAKRYARITGMTLRRRASSSRTVTSRRRRR